MNVISKIVSEAFATSTRKDKKDISITVVADGNGAAKVVIKKKYTFGCISERFKMGMQPHHHHWLKEWLEVNLA